LFMTSSLIQIVLEPQSWHVDAVPSGGSPFYSLNPETRNLAASRQGCGPVSSAVGVATILATYET
ncbi:hypothetical protein, partial [Paucimonas lemoignei]|uniref:hypothetical protein n=1 Tax=Paucimonas lemoignei TaxID=29443 RepID=UPI001A9CE555